MTCTNFPKYNLVENVTQHQVGNVTYLYKGGAPTAPLWEAITGPLAAKGVTIEGGGSVQDFIDGLAIDGSIVQVGGVTAGKVGDITKLQNVDELGLLRFDTNIVIGQDGQPNNASQRDAVHVLRTLSTLTDCHAFADRTIIDNATDAGTYGTFDSVVTLNGTHTQSHIYSYQDRVNVNGSAGSVLTDSTGLHIDSRNNGSGTVVNRIGVHVIDMANLGGGSITNSTGVVIRNITQASNNIALQIDQSSPTTFAYYAPAGGAMHNMGKVGFGAIPSTSFAVRFSNGDGNRSAFCATTPASVQFGVEDDGKIDFLTNGVERLQIQQSGNSHNVTPGTDNSQFLGQAEKRWKGVFAGQVTFTGIAAADAINNSIFIDSADGSLKFKNNSGTVSVVAS